MRACAISLSTASVPGSRPARLPLPGPLEREAKAWEALRARFSDATQSVRTEHGVVLPFRRLFAVAEK